MPISQTYVLQDVLVALDYIHVILHTVLVFLRAAKSTREHCISWCSVYINQDPVLSVKTESNVFSTQMWEALRCSYVFFALMKFVAYKWLAHVQ